MLVTRVMAQTQSWQNMNTGYTCVAGGATSGANDVATIQGITCLLANAGSVIFTLVGFAGFIMLVVGGVRFMLSGGTAQGVQQAKKTVTGTIIGLVLALSSFLIVALISEFTGVSLGTILFNSDTAPSV